jgi:poly(3-hydroxybutyrate) depolymerase
MTTTTKRPLPLATTLLLLPPLALLLAAARPGAAETREVTGFGPNPGHLRMFLHLPPDGLPAGSPLVTALHGCTQTAAAFGEASGWAGLADRYRFALLLPQQETANNADRCFDFFLPEDNRRGRGEAASIAAMVERAHAELGTDPGRVYVTGLSAGGAMTAAMLAAYPDLFAGGAVLAGVAYGCADTAGDWTLGWEKWWFQATYPAFGEAGWAAYACGIGRHGFPLPTPFDHAPAAWAARARAAGAAEPAAWPRVSLWQGTADRTVNPANLDELTDQWTALHGLAGASPSEDRVVGPYRHRAFADARGVVQVETYQVRDLPHAVPVDPDGSLPCGRAADAHFVDDDVCSAWLIARFWGLVPADG